MALPSTTKNVQANLIFETRLKHQPTIESITKIAKALGLDTNIKIAVKSY